MTAVTVERVDYDGVTSLGPGVVDVWATDGYVYARYGVTFLSTVRLTRSQTLRLISALAEHLAG